MLMLEMPLKIYSLQAVSVSLVNDLILHQKPHDKWISSFSLLHESVSFLRLS